MKLDHEAFESIKELAAIQANIAEGRDTLANLEKNKESFLAVQEAELIERLQKALKESSSYVNEINKYNDELVEYRRDTDSYIKSLRYFNERVVSVSNTIETSVSNIIAHLDEQSEAISKAKKQIKLDRENIKTEREELAMKNKLMQEQEIKLKDGQETLERAITRLKQGRI